LGDAEIVEGLPIVASGVAVVRRGTRVLDAIDVTIEPRNRTFILGANGAGKSTLLRVLHGLVAPDAGSVSWGCRTSRPAGQAMVFQRPVLLRRSAAGNVRHALALRGVRGREAQRRADDALSRVGLGAIGARPARVLSGGEQQRVALARAWALEPEVLFLDEPTASLDPPATRAVESVVEAIHARGTTIVMTTPSLGQAKRLADTVIFLSAGKVTECTNASQFFASPRSPEGRMFVEGERM
jgi:tungstate transport system ATP-binding protein